MLEIGRAFLFRVLICLGVIIAIRQTESPLVRLRDFSCAVLRILSRAKLKKRADADGVEMRNGVAQIITVLDRVDGF